ncbi:MAG: S8 family serine peptidase [Patescibacteria group bacterium]|jgi:subtilisin family serine protease
MNKKIAIFLGFFLLTYFVFYSQPINASAGNLGEILVKFKNLKYPLAIEIPQNIKQKDFLSTYQNNPAVEYVEPNFFYRASVIPSDQFYSKQWYLEKIRAPYAWDKIRETPNVVIAVIDSGVQIKHPDLYPNIWVNQDEILGNGVDDDKNGFIDDYNGWDFIGNTPDPSPKFEEGYTEAGIMHGTIVAGIIAAVGNNDSGVSGISWKAQIMPLRVLDDSGEGRTSDVIRAIDYSIANGADIINFSFVGLDYSRGLYEAIRRAHETGVVMVAAAGNEQSAGEGYDLDETPMYPACDDGEDNMVIGVAATDAVDQKASFSSYGLRCVDIAAPGGSFYSTATFAPTKKIGENFFDQYFNGYWSGTSMATPVVAGALALVQAVNPSSSGKESQEIVLATTDSIEKLNPNYQGKLGRGRVNVFSAVVLSERMMKEKVKKIILAPASGALTTIKEVDTKGLIIKEFKVYNDDIKSGINIAVGDIDNDRQDDVVASAGAGRAPELMFFSSDGVLSKKFFAYDKNFRGGVNVAVGDVDGDGKNEIITGAGPGGGPHIRVFDNLGNVKSQFFAYDKNFRGGVFVSVADIDGNTAGRGEEIIASPGKGGGPQIRIFDGAGNVKSQFFAYDKNFRGGVSASAGDLNGDGLAEIVVGAGPTGGPHVRIFTVAGKLLDSFYAFDQTFTGGVNVETILIK